MGFDLLAGPLRFLSRKDDELIININDDDDDNEDTSSLSTMIAKQYRVVKIFTEQ